MKWQTMILSATLSDDCIELVESLIEVTKIDASSSVRPTDLRLCTWNNQQIMSKRTSTTYSPLIHECGAYAFRVPIVRSEFVELLNSPHDNDGFEKIVSNSFVCDRVLNCEDMTKFAVNSFISIPVKTQDGTIRDVEEIPVLPTPEELSRLIKVLEKKNMLPVMFFSSNRAILNYYHDKVSSIFANEIDGVLEKSRIQGELRQKLAKKQIDRERQLEERDNSDFQLGSPFRFGKMFDEELKDIFKARPDGKGGFKFGFRGREVKASEYYEKKIQYGFGLHHHGLFPWVRDAVESGIRLSHIKVIFCDHSLALGLNMPIKTVVFLANREEGIETGFQPNMFVQASGRAGRWGIDQEGSIMFLGFTEDEIQEAMWGHFPPITKEEKIRFTLQPWKLLLLCSGSQLIKSKLRQWTQNINIPLWNWNAETSSSQILGGLLFLQKMGLLDHTFSPTRGGQVALSMMDEGRISLILGYVFAQYETELQESILSKNDFLFFISHFLKKRRSTEIQGSKLGERLNEYSPKLRLLMNQVSEDALLFNFGEYEMFVRETDEVTSLYATYPDCTNYHFLISASDYKSNNAHFYKKLILFQKVAKLPFGELVLERLAKDFK